MLEHPEGYWNRVGNISIIMGQPAGKKIKKFIKKNIC